jgi:hypothetical protein
MHTDHSSEKPRPALRCHAVLAAALAAALLGILGSAHAQGQAAAADVAQANNPLANFTAFNVHNYSIGELTETNQDANQFWMRYARPFAVGQTNWLMRASLPVNTYPVSPDMEHQTGLGDLNVFAAYLIPTGNPALSVGIGPQITMPTATKDALGSGQWSAGLVHTLFDASSKRFQYGYLLSWQASFAGDDNRSKVNVGGFQPFMFYQLGGGTYLRSTAVMSYNLENDSYSVPVGLGIGQVIPTPKAVFNLFIEPQWSVADKGAGWAKWQVFIGLNTQFI